MIHTKANTDTDTDTDTHQWLIQDIQDIHDIHDIHDIQRVDAAALSQSKAPTLNKLAN